VGVERDGAEGTDCCIGAAIAPSWLRMHMRQVRKAVRERQQQQQLQQQHPQFNHPLAPYSSTL